MLLKLVPFIRTVGIEIGTIESGRATATLPSRHEVHNHIGTAHAGALYTLGETATGGVVLWMFADQLPKGGFVALKSAVVAHTKAAPGDVLATATLSGEPEKVRSTYDETGKVDFDVEVRFTVGEIEVANITYRWAVRAPR